MEKTAILNQLTRSYQKLLDALAVPESQPLAIDGTIRRFECTYEIACETIHAFYQHQGLSKSQPHRCLREALRSGWIDHHESWASLMESRHHAAFMFSEQLTRDVYETIKKSHHAFDGLIARCRTLSLQ